MPPPSSKRLAIHLNDHLAVATGIRELGKRIVSQHGGSDFGQLGRRVLPHLEEDARAIEDVMRRVGARPDRVKQALAGVGEKAGRLKPNGQLRGSSPLSALVELEALLLGLEGNGSLWRTLSLVADDLGLDAAPFEAAAERARADREAVEAQRHAIAARALAG